MTDAQTTVNHSKTRRLRTAIRPVFGVISFANTRVLPTTKQVMQRAKIAKNPLRGFASHSANQAPPSTNQASPDLSQLPQ